MKSSMLHQLILSGLLTATNAQADTVDDLLTDYRSQGASHFNPSKGEALWQRQFPASNGTERACTGCHTHDPRQSGQHTVTNKTIGPMAPSMNPKRLSDRRKVEKWFKRNCKWTVGRECTPQEKGDVLSFLRNQ